VSRRRAPVADAPGSPGCPSRPDGSAIIGDASSRGSGTGMVAVAEFEQVSKVYAAPLPWRPGLRAVADVSRRVEPGEVFGLLGPNRAGKTTLIKLLLTLCQPTGGRVLRLGRPGSDRATLGRFGYVHENQAFPRYLTAAALLEYYGALTLLPQPEVQGRI